MDNLLAAVDLGSNSFRLSIGRVVQRDGVPQIYQIDRLKETVRLAAGLDSQRRLDAPTIERAVSVLQRFGERIRNFPPARVRVVATNTFRIARNIGDLLPRAEAALGFPIEVISGREEARLIFSGVAHTLPPSEANRLVVDIGGGSTELIIGQQYEPRQMTSLYMGCVSYSRQFFPGGAIDAHQMKLAQLAALNELESIARPYRQTGWQEAYGSSGTSKALYAILTESGFAKQAITRDGMEKLRKKLIADGRVIAAELPGIKLERADVLPGGLAIMLAVFEALGIDTMQTGDGALRLGVLHDLLGRDAASDKRDESVRQFMARYHVDVAQAARVRKTALSFFDQIRPDDGSSDRQEMATALGWAADLHEIGLSIAHNGYAKHTAYVLDNADMPGFSQDDQDRLAAITLAHYGKLNRAGTPIIKQPEWPAILCLRLAVLLHRGRADLDDVPLSLSVRKQSIIIRLQRDWLDAHPLTEYNLQAEEEEWRKAGFDFEIMAR